MLEKLLPAWKGKLFVIVLLGFAATDFLITMTLSAADATEHLTENPLIPSTAQHHHVLITLVLLGLLGAIFLKGIREAIGIAVALVAAYFVLSAVVIAVGLWHVALHPAALNDDRHLVVRGCFGDGGDAQPDPAGPAEVRDGAALGARYVRWCSC
jgi:protein-S-isoprenylcysteine O-methyltransferase Ste14